MLTSRLSNPARWVFSLVLCLMMLFVVQTPAFAESIDNDIITQSQDQDDTQDDKKGSTDNFYQNPMTDDQETSDEYVDYAGDLFGDVKLDKDDSYAQPAIDALRRVVSIVVSIAISFLPLWIVLNTVIDVLCILAEPIMWMFANVVPIQLFSNEVSQVTGVQFAGKNANAATQTVDLKDQNKFVWYLRQKLVTTLFAMLMIVLVSTGIYFDILNWVINGIVSAIVSFLPAA